MSCASCNKRKRRGGYSQPSAMDFQPLGASDVMIYDQDNVRKLTLKDWSENRHKLLLFMPDVDISICDLEFGELKKWIKEFDKLNCDIFGISTDPIHYIKDFIEGESLLKDVNFKMLSSYILPTRLNIMNNGKSKRANVFILTDGDVVIQEQFFKVSRNMSELHRQLWGYINEEYCTSNWEVPK